jgi:hypothetical protein
VSQNEPRRPETTEEDRVTAVGRVLDYIGTTFAFSPRMMRVLRWNFKHHGEAPVICELCLTGCDRDYELRVPREWSPIGRSIERFDDAFAAFQRHAMIERLLLDAGWTLHTFESEKVTIH